MDQENKPIRRKFPYEPSQELKKSEFISLSQRKKLSAKKEEETQKVQNYDNMIIETHIQPGIIYSTPIPQNFISDEDDTNNMQPLKPFTEGCLGNSVTDLFKKEREEEEKMYKKEEEILKGNQEVIDEIKGEIVLIIDGATTKEIKSDLISLSVQEHMNHYLEQGMDEKEAMKSVAKDRGVSKSIIYQQIKRK